MTESIDMYGGRHPRDVAFYAPADAARILRVNPATVGTWAFGRTYKTREGLQEWPALIDAADLTARRLSFRNLVELYVLGVLRGKGGRAEKPDRVRIDKIREATLRLRSRLRTDHPLADVDLHTDWVDIYVDFFGELENVTEAQLSLGPIVKRHLQRIDRDEHGLARRLFPATRDDDDGPRAVVIDPARRFGRPVLDAVNVETSAIADRYFAGEEPASIARDLRIAEADVNEAVRFEHRFRDAA